MFSLLLRRELGQRDLLLHIGAGVGAGVFLAVACLRFTPLWTLVALLVGALILATLKRPEIGLLGILVATSSIIFEGTLPLVSIGLGSLQISDIILLTLLAMIVVRRLAERDFRLVRTPIDVPLLAFYGLSLLSTTVAVVQTSVDINSAFRGIRIVTYYLSFFIVTNLVREDRQLKFLVRGVYYLATVVAAAMVAQFVLGESVHILPGRVETLSTQGTSYAGVFRILPPGQSLVLVAFITATVALVLAGFKPARTLMFLQWGLLGLVVILTFNRSFWVAVLLAVLLLFYLIRGTDRERIFGWSVFAMALIAMVVLSVADKPESEVAKILRASSDRLTTLVKSETLRESSLQLRYIEVEHALSQIVAHPLIGLGLGAKYRGWDPRLDWKGASGTGFDGTGYIHNGHVWIMLTSGLLGYLFFAVLSFVFLRRGFRHWSRIPSREMKGIVLGLTLTYLGVVVGAVVDPMFMQWFWTPVIGIMMGANEAALRLAQTKSVDRREKHMEGERARV